MSFSKIGIQQKNLNAYYGKIFFHINPYILINQYLLTDIICKFNFLPSPSNL